MKFNDIFLDEIFLMYDIIVFEILRIHTYTRKRKAGVFKNLNLGELFLKRCVFGDCFHRTRVDGRPNRRKNLRLKKKKNGFVWMGPEPVTFFAVPVSVAVFVT